MNDILITSRLRISRSEIRFRFSRSGGPGGQHVNKVATKVELIFDVESSDSLTRAQKERILHSLKSFLVGSTVCITLQESRSQMENRKRAVEKFVRLIREAVRPRKPRVATSPTRSSRARRRDEKTRRGYTKAMRSKPKTE